MLLCSENATRQLSWIEGVPDFVLIGENLKFLWKLRWLFFFLNSNLSLKYIPTKKLIKKIEDSHEEARTAWSSGATTPSVCRAWSLIQALCFPTPGSKGQDNQIYEKTKRFRSFCLKVFHDFQLNKRCVSSRPESRHTYKKHTLQKWPKFSPRIKLWKFTVSSTKQLFQFSPKGMVRF